MTQDEIIEMAREAGLIHILDEHAHEYGSGTFENTPYPELEAFANLIAAKEREACAKVAEKFEPDEKTSYVTYASTAIRARGQA